MSTKKNVWKVSPKMYKRGVRKTPVKRNGKTVRKSIKLLRGF